MVETLVSVSLSIRRLANALRFSSLPRCPRVLPWSVPGFSWRMQTIATAYLWAIAMSREMTSKASASSFGLVHKSATPSRITKSTLPLVSSSCFRVCPSISMRSLRANITRGRETSLSLTSGKPERETLRETKPCQSAGLCSVSRWMIAPSA